MYKDGVHGQFRSLLPSMERRCSLTHEQFGILGFSIVTLSILPYAWKIARGKASQSVTGWLIGTATGLVTFVTYGGIGADDNLWVAAIELVDPALVAVAAIIGQNQWKKLSKYDLGAIVLATTGLITHIVANRYGFENIAYFSALAADICGATQVVVFAWKEPRSEQPIPWAISVIGTVLGFFSIAEWTIGQTSLPIYQLLFCLLILYPATRYRIRNKIPIRRWF